MTSHRIRLARHHFTPAPFELMSGHGLCAELFTYASGVEAVRLRNHRGNIVVLPYMGQMIWSAEFDGVGLGMQSPFTQPRRTNELLGTYGCFLYHSGLLRNGNPGPADDHPLHGEMPCAAMDSAGLEIGEDERGTWLAVTGEVEYLRGFGDHYLGRPRVVLRPEDTRFDVCMEVTNLGLEPMTLMYMCHANFAFAEGARLVQPTSFSAADTVARTSVPAIAAADAAYLQRLAAMARDPSSTQWLDDPARFDPELVFYLRGLRLDAHGLARFMMRRREGDGFSVQYDPREFAHAIRWILHTTRARVCGFAMPATCEVEGYRAEREKGNVRLLPGGSTARFEVHLGYLDAPAAQAEDTVIRSL